VLKNILETHDLEVATAESAEEAIDYLSDSRPDIIFMDHEMPGMDGLELLRELHRRDPDLPVVMITAYGTMELAIQAMRSGAYDYITKPFDFSELEARCRSVLRHRGGVAANRVAFADAVLALHE